MKPRLSRRTFRILRIAFAIVILLGALIGHLIPIDQSVLFPVSLGKGRSGFVNQHGQLVFYGPWWATTGFKKEGVAIAALDQEGEKLVAIDRNGKVTSGFDPKWKKQQLNDLVLLKHEDKYDPYDYVQNELREGDDGIAHDIFHPQYWRMSYYSQLGEHLPKLDQAPDWAGHQSVRSKKARGPKPREILIVARRLRTDKTMGQRILELTKSSLGEFGSKIVPKPNDNWLECRLYRGDGTIIWRNDTWWGTMDLLLIGFASFWILLELVLLARRKKAVVASQ